MRLRAKLAAAILLALLPACPPNQAGDATRAAASTSAAASAAADANSGAEAQAHGFPVHPALRYLCAGSVHSPTGEEIRWTILVADVAPADIVAFYDRSLAGAAREQNAREWSWSLPGAAKPERVLSISAPATAFVPADCGSPVPPSARTVANVSEMHGGG